MTTREGERRTVGERGGSKRPRCVSPQDARLPTAAVVKRADYSGRVVREPQRERLSTATWLGCPPRITGGRG
jgi:hypothetical protein